MAKHMGFVATGRLERRINRMAKARGLRLSQWFRVVVEDEWKRFEVHPEQRTRAERTGD